MNAEAEPRVFTTTRWSLVLAGANAEGDEQKATEALAELCRTYWRPVFSYVVAAAIRVRTRRTLRRISS